jgi:hypothetical protein
VRATVADLAQVSPQSLEVVTTKGQRLPHERSPGLWTQATRPLAILKAVRPQLLFGNRVGAAADQLRPSSTETLRVGPPVLRIKAMIWSPSRQSAGWT